MDVNENLKEKLMDLLDQFVYDDWHGNGDIADKLIANGVTVQEWILVKDRLPRKEEYTATTEYGTEYYIRLLIAYKTDTVEYEIGY